MMVMRKRRSQSFRATSLNMACRWPTITLRAVLILGCMAILGCGSKEPKRVQAIRIIQYGIMEYGDASLERDKTSSIKADISRASAIRIAVPTDRIPLREGLSYGISFVVEGPVTSQTIPVKVILKSSHPCVLRSTGEIVYQNDTVMEARIGVPRYVGGRIVSEKENLCVGSSQQRGSETFEIYYGGKKYAEQRFEMVTDDGIQ